MPVDGLDFVTVVYEPEQPLLQLQARSLARYLDIAIAHRLIIIDNSRPPMRRHHTSALLREYGDFASAVEILTPDDLDITVDTWGDRGQQALKLAIADRISTRRYVVLDAKNHLVAPLTSEWLEAPDGRIRRRVHSYIGHPREDGLRSVLRYFDLDPSLLECFTASTTPFVMETSTVRALMRHIENRHGKDFASVFLTSGMTEFTLYTAWELSTRTTMEQTYALDGPVLPALWPHMATADGVRELVAAAGDSIPFFSVHREALAHLDVEGVKVLAAFWASRDLFSEQHAGEQFIANYKHRYHRLTLTRKMRRAPRKILDAALARGRLGAS